MDVLTISRAGRRRFAIVGLVTAVALGLAACGGGGGGTEATPTTEAAPPATTEAAPPTETGPAPADAYPVVDYVAFTGGTAGAADPSLEPIAVGYANWESGAGNQAATTLGAQAAIDYVNQYLGGIGGHPLELHSCFMASGGDPEAEGLRCGQQLVNDDAVSIIAYGAVFFGNQSLASAVGGKKPILNGVSSPFDEKVPNMYSLFGSQTSVLAPWATFLTDVLGAQTAAVVYPEQAGADTAAQSFKVGLDAAGIENKIVGYNPSQPDVLGALTAAGLEDADAFIPSGDQTTCVIIAQALESIGSTTPVVSGPLCLAPPVAEGLGGDFPKWIYGIAQSLPNDVTAPDSKAYLDASALVGLSPADAGNVFSALVWSEIMVTARLMNAVGADNITPDALGAGIQAFEGPLPMGAPTLDCGYDPNAPAVCNNQTKFYQYNGGLFEGNPDAFTAASDWLRPPGQ